LRKVLVVEDSGFDGRLVELVLCSHGWQVQTCGGPFGVLNKLKEFEPDVILLDLEMPGLYGYSLASLLKEHAGGRDVKMVSFSAVDERLQKEYVDKGMFDGYFMKSHDLYGLKEMLDELFDAP